MLILNRGEQAKITVTTTQSAAAAPAVPARAESVHNRRLADRRQEQIIL